MNIHGSVAFVLSLGLLAACGGGGGPTMTQAELEDPESCKTCHPNHYRDWSGSMHAYAADDPVFIAMNKRAQRETKGALGPFCVQCHAPMAVREGATTDGTNLADLPQHLKGITCYFCHSVDAVQGVHNDPLKLASDGVLRAAISDPAASAPHGAGYSKLLDRLQPDAAALCGSCHDIVTPQNAHVERTFSEWQGTLFSHPPAELTCGECHMAGSQGLAANAPGTGLRTVHAHDFPGVDVALTDFAEKTAQAAAVQAKLDATLQAAICVKGAGFPGQTQIQLVIDNVGAGHKWPSGATPDRRAWVEVEAYSKGEIFYQSGKVADGESVLDISDPDLWVVRDCLFDGQGKPTDLFWQAASFDSNQFPGPVTIDPTDPRFYMTHVIENYPRTSSKPGYLMKTPDKVTMRVRLIPIGLDVLDELVGSGDLDKSIRDAMPVYSLGGTDVEWTPAAATIHYLDQGLPVACAAIGLMAGANTGQPAPKHTKCTR